ncbi:TIR domain-containing protein [Salinifilum ghardaiensis]
MGSRDGRGAKPVRRPGFDAFISYSHAVDGKLAPALQREVERFATPWHRARSLRVFRDDANLTASPELWSSIERALHSSRWFVLMASPQAARSPWVDAEVAWWLANRSAQRLLIVLTDGEFAWDERAGGVDWSTTTALPPALHGALREEPRWVDLRWLRSAEQVDRSNPRMRDNIADIAAAIREMPKDSLVGAHIRHQRRTVRLATAAVSTLSLLLVATLIASAVAVVQRNAAVEEAETARARQLAGLAVANLDSDLEAAQLLAAEAYRTRADAQTRSALFRSAAANPELTRFLPAGAEVTTATGATDAGVVVAGTADGRVLRWDLTRGSRATGRIGNAPITDLATDSTGEAVLATDGSAVRTWNASMDRDRTVHSGPSTAVTVTPSGRHLAVLTRAPNGQEAELIAYATSSRRAGSASARAAVPATFSELDAPEDDALVLSTKSGQWQRRTLPELGEEATSRQPLTPASAGTTGSSADGTYFGVDIYGRASIWDREDSPENPPWKHPDLTTTTGTTRGDRADDFTISHDGSRTATAVGGAVYVSSTAPDEQKFVPEALTGTDTTTRGTLSFVGEHRLVSASGSTLAVRNLNAPGRIGSDAGIQLDHGVSANSPRLAAAPGEDVAAYSSSDEIITYRTRGAPETRKLFGENDLAGSDIMLPVWSPDGRRLALLGADHAALVVHPDAPESTGRNWSPVRPAPGSTPVAARISADGGTIAALGSRGDGVVRSFPDGEVQRTFPGNVPPYASPRILSPEEAAISHDLARAAVAEESNAAVIDLRTGQRRQLPGGPAEAVTFTADRLLVLRGDGAVEVWNNAGTQRLQSIPGTEGDFLPVLAAQPNGNLIARLRTDNTIVLTQLDSGAPLGSFTMWRPADTNSAMTFTADGDHLLVATPNARLTRWQMTEGSWLREVCARAGRDLTAAEWHNYVGTEPPEDLRCAR